MTDPSSLSGASAYRVTAIDLHLDIDFTSFCVYGDAELTLTKDKPGNTVVFDSNDGLEIVSARFLREDSAAFSLPVVIGDTHKALGRAVTLNLESVAASGPTVRVIVFSSSSVSV